MDARPHGATRNTLVSLAILAAGVGLAVAVVALQTGSATGLLDLRIYIGAAQASISGSAYDHTEAVYGLGSTYPPAWSLLLRPVSSLDIHVLEHVWTLLGLVLWFVTIRLVQLGSAATSFRTVVARPDRPDFVLACAMWLLSLVTAPVWNTLNQGQINILLWLLIVTDLVLVVRSARSAGAFVGLATALKLTPGIFVLAYLLAGRRAAAGRAVVAFAVVTALAAVLAWSDSRYYWGTLVFESSRVGDLDATENNSIAGLLHRLGVPASMAVALGAVGALGLLVGLRRPLRAALDRGDVAWVAVAIGSVGALLSPISWTHHLIFLTFLLPMVLRHEPWSIARRWLVVAAIEVVLIDPLGFGRSGFTSSVRTLALVVLVVVLGFGPARPGRAPVPDAASAASGGRS